MFVPETEGYTVLSYSGCDRNPTESYSTYDAFTVQRQHTAFPIVFTVRTVQHWLTTQSNLAGYRSDLRSLIKPATETKQHNLIKLVTATELHGLIHLVTETELNRLIQLVAEAELHISIELVAETELHSLTQLVAEKELHIPFELVTETEFYSLLQLQRQSYTVSFSL